MRFNEQIEMIEGSRATVLLKKTRELMKVDPEILNMTAGEPDFDAPKAVLDEVAYQLSLGNTHYSDSLGDLDLREKLVEKFKEEQGIVMSPDQILITPGAKFAVYLAIRALVNPGDQVMWLTPGWLSYPAIVTASGGVPVSVPLKLDEDFKLNMEVLESKVTDKTKVLIINSPNNPTGHVFSREELDILAEFLNRHPEIYVISDEIYEKILFSGNEAISIASYPGMQDRTVIINGFSKSSAMTGFRIGYLACGRDLYQRILRLFQHTISCTSSFVQKAAIKALDCKEEMEAMRQEYEARRNLLVEGVKKIPGLSVSQPQGAFYAWIRFDTDKDSETICKELLEKVKVSGIPGVAFGEEEDNCVRFSYATSQENISKLLDRLGVYVEKYL